MKNINELLCGPDNLRADLLERIKIYKSEYAKTCDFERAAGLHSGDYKKILDGDIRVSIDRLHKILTNLVEVGRNNYEQTKK